MTPAFPTGLGAKVVNATIETLEDGTAKDTFWLTDRMNKKVGPGPRAVLTHPST